MNFNDTDIAVLILAGGKSSRFGTDKALAAWDGNETFIAHLASTARQTGLPVLVSVDRLGRYPAYGLAEIKDREPGLGPLGGLISAAASGFYDAYLVLNCDMPEITMRHLTQLIASYLASNSAVVFEIDGEATPFPGVYPAELAGDLRAYLAAGRRDVKGFIKSLRNRRTIPCAEEYALRCNVNTRAEYDAWQDAM